MDFSGNDLRRRDRRDYFELRHHSVVFVLQDMAVEHVFAEVIRELHFQLERLART